jgi:hypothetical protein
LSRRKRRKIIPAQPRWRRQTKLVLAMVLVTVIFVVVIVVARSLTG